MNVTVAQQQALFALNTKVDGWPFPALSMLDGALTLELCSIDNPARVIINPDGTVGAISFQEATTGWSSEDKPWIDVNEHPSPRRMQIADYFRGVVTRAQADDVVNSSTFNTPATSAGVTGVPWDAQEALRDPAAALTVAQTAAHPELRAELAQMLHAIEQASLADAPRIPWRMIDTTKADNARTQSEGIARALLTAIATTGDATTVILPNSAVPTDQQAAAAALLFTTYWINHR